MGFKICAIGCGRHASMVHGPSLRRYGSERDGVILSACCDVDLTAAEKYAAEFGFGNSYTDWEAMVEREKPDGINLVLPEPLTPLIAEKILKKGIPCILEKPPALTAEALDPLVRAARKSGAPNRVAFNRRYTPLIAELRGRLELNEKSPRSIAYYMGRHDRRDRDFSTTAIHAIDAVRFLSGSDYERLRFSYRDLSRFGEGIVNVTMEGTMKDGTDVLLEFYPMAGTVLERARIHEIGRTMILETPMFGGFDAPGRLQTFAGGKLEETVTGAQVSQGEEMFESCGFYSENATFFDGLREGKEITDGVEAARQSVEVAQFFRERRKEYTA